MGYTLLHRDDPEIEVFRDRFRKIRRSLGTTAFGLNEIELPPDQAGPEHDEVKTGHDEVYVILAGGGTFTIDGEDVAVAVGHYLRVEPETVRKASAGAEGMRFLVIGAKPRPEYDGRSTL